MQPSLVAGELLRMLSGRQLPLEQHLESCKALEVEMVVYNEFQVLWSQGTFPLA